MDREAVLVAYIFFVLVGLPFGVYLLGKLPRRKH